MTLFEINEASSLIQSEAHEDANIIFGTVVDEDMGDEIRITVIATGFNEAEKHKQVVKNFSRMGHKRDDLSMPAYLRHEKPIENVNVVKMGMVDDIDHMDLEIPTFLRRQAD
jgi:cell division protein FtsZ